MFQSDLPRSGPGGAERPRARNYSQCDSLLIGENCGSHTVPYIENRSKTAVIEHEATTSKISDEQLFTVCSAVSAKRKLSV